MFNFVKILDFVKNILFLYQNHFQHLVDDNSIASAVRNLTHATIGHPSKLKEEFGNINFQQQKNFILNLMTSCSCLTVLTELVEQQKDHCVAILEMILMMTMMMMTIMIMMTCRQDDNENLTSLATERTS